MSKYKLVNRNINLEALAPYISNTDCLYIVDWLIGFMKNGNMITKTLKNPNTGSYEKFYRVKYNGLLDDIKDIVSYKSQKTLVRRLEYMCDKGLLNFVMDKSYGTYTYYNFNPDKLAEILDGKSKTQEELLKTYEKNPSSDSYPQDNHRTTLSKPQDNTVSSIGQDNVVYPKNKITNNKLTTTTNEEEVVVDGGLINEIKDIVLNVFGTISCFSSSLFNKLATFMKDKDMSLFSNYVLWCKNDAEAKSKTNFEGYFYRIITMPNIWNTFIASNEQKEVVKDTVTASSNTNLVTCPSCGNLIPPYSSCPYCELDYDSFTNPKDILFHKNFFNLSPIDRESCGKELKTITFKYLQKDKLKLSKERDEELQCVYDKYKLYQA